MKNEKLFNETIDKLVKAYFEGTLEHRDCKACAVGNILNGYWLWKEYFFTAKTEKVGRLCSDVVIRTHGEFSQLRLRDFDSGLPKMPYSQQELMDIEWAFETAPKEGDWEFNGLMAVVDVLEKIHECDKETTTATKQRFIKPGTRPVKQDDELNEIIESGDLEAFNNYFKGLHL